MLEREIQVIKQHTRPFLDLDITLERLGLEQCGPLRESWTTEGKREREWEMASKTTREYISSQCTSPTQVHQVHWAQVAAPSFFLSSSSSFFTTDVINTRIYRYVYVYIYIFLSLSYSFAANASGFFFFLSLSLCSFIVSSCFIALLLLLHTYVYVCMCIHTLDWDDQDAYTYLKLYSHMHV